MMDIDVIELPDQGDNIIRTVDPVVEVNRKGLADEIIVCMKENADKLAQIDAESGTRETCKEVLERSIRVAVNLRKHGVQPKDVITLCSTNHVNTSVVFYATLFVGAIPANMGPFSPDDEQEKQLALIKPTFLFTVPEIVDKLERMVKQLGLNTKIIVFGQSCFDQFLIPKLQDEENFTAYEVNDLQDTVLVVFSSGTSGLPKGICLSQYSLLTTMGLITKGLKGGYLSFATMVSFSATVSSLMSALFGFTRYLCNGFSVEKTWNYLKRYKPTSLAIAPVEYMALIRSEKPKELDLSQLVTVSVSGGGISLQSRMEGKKFFPNSTIFVGYGQTELTGICVTLQFTKEGLEVYQRKPIMCGIPMKGFTYKIVDPDTEKILGPNQTGELRIKSKFVMNGYYNMAADDRFDKDGFLKTGDLLYYDEDHCFFFVERLKEALRYKQCPIAPLELENILLDHPSVKIAVVLGKPTDEGDLPFAVVVKNDDAVTAEELEQLVAEKVDDRKRLRGGVVFIKEHEVLFTPSGKIRRRVLRKHVLDNNLI